MNLPIGQLIQRASESRNAYVGGQQDRKKDDLAQALMARKLAREEQEQSLRDALTRRTLDTPIAQPRDYVKEHEANRLFDNANPAPKVEEPPTQQHVVDPVTGKVTFYDPKKPPADLTVTPRPVREPAPRRDPVKDHIEMRDYDNTHRPPPESASRPPTEFQQKMGIVLPNAQSAAKRIRAYIDKNGTVPLRTEIGQYKIGQYGLSDDEQQFRAAAEMLLAAILRPETGAAVTDEEWAKYANVFIPMPGNKPGMVKQKIEEIDRRLGSMQGVLSPQQKGGGDQSKADGKITSAERAALKAKGFTDAQITAKYGPGDSEPEMSGRGSLPRPDDDAIEWNF